MQAKYGDLYSEQNVALSGIHTHSGPGGYLEYVLYDITSWGFVRQSFDALVNGIVKVGKCTALPALQFMCADFQACFCPRTAFGSHPSFDFRMSARYA